MIKRVKVKNIQSHKESEIAFHPNVNLLTGRSNSGKTALIRALLMLLTNRPLGDRWKSWWANEKDSMQVECEVPGKTITLAHGKKRSYKMDGEEYSGIRGDIPDTIRKVLNIGDLNIQRQFDQPFLIASAPGEVARTINRIIQLEKVEEWIRSLTSRINKSNQESKIHKEDLERTKEAIKALEWVDNADKDIAEAEKIEKEIEREGKKEIELNHLISDVEDIFASMMLSRNRIEGVTSEIEQCDKLAERMQRAVEEVTILSSYIATCEETKRAGRNLAFIPAIDTLERDAALIEIEQLQMRKLTSTINEINGISDQIKRSFNDLDTFRVELYNAVMNFRKCPTCGQEVSTDIINHIVEEL